MQYKSMQNEFFKITSKPFDDNNQGIPVESVMSLFTRIHSYNLSVQDIHDEYSPQELECLVQIGQAYLMEVDLKDLPNDCPKIEMDKELHSLAKAVSMKSIKDTMQITIDTLPTFLPLKGRHYT